MPDHRTERGASGDRGMGRDNGLPTPDHEKNNFRPGMGERRFRTGRHYALDLVKRFPGQDFIAVLLEACERRRDEVEWHLQEDMVPPDDIRTACERLLSGAASGGGEAL